MKETINSHVQRNMWAPDDEYLTVSVQVDSFKFKQGDRVKVIVEHN